MKLKNALDLAKKFAPIMKRFGGDWFEYPQTHKLGMKVPEGGSCCGNCKFLTSDHKGCSEPNWIQWNGGNNELPEEDEKYCCDLYSANKV